MNEGTDKRGFVSRRKFLIAGIAVGGGLIVGAHFATRRDFLGDPAILDTREGEVALSAWLKIAPDGSVTVAVPRSEMGQGVHTALPMLVADELGADWATVRVEQAPVARVYGNVEVMVDGLPIDPDGEGAFARFARWSARKLGSGLGIQMTGGSSSIRDAWEPMRLAGAVGREMLIAAAAARWGASRDECSAERGQVVHAGDGRQLGFGELAADAALIAPPSPWPELKRAADFDLIGKPLPRMDAAEKTDGSAVFGIDVKLPGMLHATVRLCPVFGGSVESFEESAVKDMPGFYKVVEIPDGVAAIADGYWNAKKILEALPITFDEGPHASLDDATVYRRLVDDLAAGDAHVFEERGDVDGALKDSARVLEAEYRVPYLAHACMEPINCTARIADGTCDVWAPNQAPSILRDVAADVAGIPKKNVNVHTTLLGGGFGRRFEMDVVRQAVNAAKHTEGRPVHLVWSREEDIQHDVYRPIALCRFKAGLDGDGRPVAWLAREVSQAPSAAVAARNLGLPLGMADKTTAEGLAHQAYAVPHRRVEHVVTDLPVPVGFWRSVGHSHNAFFTESFVDEMAHAASEDPVAFRRALLENHPRYLAVLDMAAEKAGWGSALSAGTGRGIALHRSFSSIVAQAAEVTISSDGRPRVERVTCVIDCGQVVNPDIVIAQMESGIVFGLSAVFYGEINLADGRVQQTNFPNYPVLRLADMPQIDTYIIESNAPPGGVGEPGTPPVAPAVANAIFSLTGKRIRRLPIRPGDLPA